jgi:hypothetical protein
LDCDNTYAERFFLAFLGLRGSGKFFGRVCGLSLFALAFQAQLDGFDQAVSSHLGAKSLGKQPGPGGSDPSHLGWLEASAERLKVQDKDDTTSY